jgi:hypothetical protein
MTLEDLADRRAVKARQRRQTHRPPVRALPGVNDPLLLLGVSAWGQDFGTGRLGAKQLKS